MFTVAGLSRQNGTLKLRFANDFVTRVKVLQRNGHKDINLVELEQAMTKDAAVAYLTTLTDTFGFIEAQSVFADYQSKNVKAKATVAVVDKAQEKREKDAKRKRDARAAAKAKEAEIDYSTLDH